MIEHLDTAWPLASYPFLAVLPTSEVLMVAGKIIQAYAISPSTFKLALSRTFPARPDGIPWTYPQTGVATLLPLDPANNYAAKVVHLASCSLSLVGQSQSPVKGKPEWPYAYYRFIKSKKALNRSVTVCSRARRQRPHQTVQCWCRDSLHAVIHNLAYRRSAAQT